MRYPITIDSQNKKIFGTVFDPQIAYLLHKKVGLVFCSPLADERNDTRRLFIEMASTLERQGILSVVFDYLGCGNSEGEFEQVTLESMLSDIRETIRILYREFCVDVVGLAGIRLGANLAVQVAAQDANIGFLILWDPIIDISSYLNTVYIRWQLMENWQTGSTISASQIKTNLLCGNAVILRGYKFCGELYKALISWNVWKCRVSDRPAYILYFESASAKKKSHTLQEIAGCFDTDKLSREVISVSKALWWENRAIETTSELTADIVARTLKWFQINFINSLQASTILKFPTHHQQPTTIKSNRWLENQVIMPGAKYKLLGILHFSHQQNQRKSGVLFLDFHFGKSGKNRVFYYLAQELGKEGFCSLRFDFSGRGDSEGFSDEVNLPSMVADTLSVLRYIEENNLASSVHIVGHCFGGITGIYTASQHSMVRSVVCWAVPLNVFKLPDIQEIQIPGWYQENHISLYEAVLNLKVSTSFIYDKYYTKADACFLSIKEIYQHTSAPYRFYIVNGPCFSSVWKNEIIQKTLEILEQSD